MAETVRDCGIAAIFLNVVGPLGRSLAKGESGIVLLLAAGSGLLVRRGALRTLSVLPRGSRYPVFEVSGSGCWSQGPQILGVSTLQACESRHLQSKMSRSNLPICTPQCTSVTGLMVSIRWYLGFL